MVETEGSAIPSGKALMSEVDRAAACHDQFLAGKELARTGQVRHCVCHVDEDGSSLVGLVRDAHDVCAASVSFEDGFATRDRCTCSYHQTYQGLCAHVVAVALTFAAAVTGELDDELGSQHRVAFVERKLKPPHPRAWKLPLHRVFPDATDRPAWSPVVSDPRIKVLIDPSTAATARDEDAGTTVDDVPVDLSVVLSAPADDTRAFEASLRLHCGTLSYVIKNCADLVDAWQGERVVSYGKRLTFRHAHTRFTDHANDLLAFLSAIVRARQLPCAPAGAGGGLATVTRGRGAAKRLPLTATQALALCQLEVGRTIGFATMATTGTRAAGKTRTLMVTRGAPDIRVRLTHGPLAWYLTLEPADWDAFGDGRTMAVRQGEILFLPTEAFARDVGPLLSARPPLEGRLAIAEGDMRAFCTQVVPALARHATFIAPAEVNALLPAEPDLEFHIKEQAGALCCRARARRGSRCRDLFIDDATRRPSLGETTEDRARTLVASYFPHVRPDDPDGRQRPARWCASLDVADDDSYVRLFTEGLDALAECGSVYLSDQLGRIRVRRAPRIQVDARITDGRLELVARAVGATAEELCSCLASHREGQRFARLRSGDVIAWSDALTALHTLVDTARIAAIDLLGQGVRTGIHLVPFVEGTLTAVTGIELTRDATFAAIASTVRHAGDADLPVPDQVTCELAPFQAQGFRWLASLATWGLPALVADGMGLGRHAMLIAFLTHAHKVRRVAAPSLIVCPSPLAATWEATANGLCPALVVRTVAGGWRERAKVLTDACAELLICPLDLVAHVASDLAGRQLFALVVDGPLLGKGTAAQTARTLAPLDAAVRLALADIEPKDRRKEACDMLGVLLPELTDAGHAPTRGAGHRDAQADARLLRTFTPLVLRRRARDVALEASDASEALVLVQLAPEQRKRYYARAQDLRRRVGRSTHADFDGMREELANELTELVWLCLDPRLADEGYEGPSSKLDACMELVERARAGGHRPLILAHDPKMRALIASRLDERGLTWLAYDARASVLERKGIVNRFRQGSPDLLLASPTDRDLIRSSCTDLVICYDPYPNGTEEAAAGAYRSLQERETRIFRLVARNTVEERLQMQPPATDSQETGAGRSLPDRDELMRLLTP